MDKTTAFHTKNIPSQYLNADGSIPSEMKVRKVSRATLVTEGTDQNYYYLGRHFFQDVGTPKGYYGRFKMGGRYGASSLEEMLNLIDNLMNQA